MKKEELLRLYMRIASLINLEPNRVELLRSIFDKIDEDIVDTETLRSISSMFPDDMRVYEFITQLLVTTNVKNLDDYSIELYSGLAKRNHDIFNRSFGEPEDSKIL